MCDACPGLLGWVDVFITNRRLVKAFRDKGHSVACFEGVPLFLVTTPGDALAMLGAWSFWHSSSGGTRE